MIFSTTSPGIPDHHTFSATPASAPTYIAPVTRDQVAAAAFVEDPALLDQQNSAFLDSCIDTATALAWNMTGFEADPRTVELRWGGDASPVTAFYSAWIRLSVWPVTSIDSVTLVDFDNNEVAVDVAATELTAKPPKIRLDRSGIEHSREFSSMRIEATVGSTDDAQRSPYAFAVAQAAAHMFLNRTAAGSPLADSGALATLKRYRVGSVI